MSPADAFLRPMFGLPAWGVKQGHGSFLTFEFGEPALKVVEWSRNGVLRRTADAQGRWHLWIYCCHWKVIQDQEQLAWSEDDRVRISRAAAWLNGQKLMAVKVDPASGGSTFTFDLGGSLETWPYGDDPAEEQWIVHADCEVFAYRADGKYSRGLEDEPLDDRQWLPLL